MRTPLVLALLGAAACQRGAGAPPLAMTISGLLSPEAIARDRDELDRYFEALWSRPVRVESIRDPAVVAHALAGGKLDLALLSPLRFVIARREVPALEPFARIVLAGEKAYTGVLVTRRADGVGALGDLEGKRVCWTSTSSTSGYLYPRALLRKQGFDPDTLFAETLLTGSHQASLRALLDKRCDVAATYPVAYERDFKDAPPETFAAIATTSKIPYDPLVVRPGFAADELAAMRTALFAAAGRKIALPRELALRKLTRYDPATAADYEEVAAVLASELAAHAPEKPF